MKLRTLLTAVLGAALLLGAAWQAQAGIRIRYVDSHLRIGATFGGWPYGWGHRGHFGHYILGGAYWPSYYYGPYYYPYPVTVLPTRLGNLPYIPPGTIYTTDPSAYRYRYYYGAYGGYPYAYRYSYRYPYGDGFAAALLETAPSVRRETIASAEPSPAPQMQNQTQVIVQVTPAAGSETRVTVNSKSWDANEWRVPVSRDPQPGAANHVNYTEPQPSRSSPAERSGTDRQQARAEVPRETEEYYLSQLVRGDDDDREEAAEKLKRFNTPQSVAALTDALRKDGEDDVREQAARSLGEMLAYKAHAALWQAAREDSDRGVRNEARDAALKIEAYYDLKK